MEAKQVEHSAATHGYPQGGSVTISEWNNKWRESIRITEDEIHEYRNQGLTSDDQEIWFRENMVEHMQLKLIGG